MATVERTYHAVERRERLTTLEQRFRFGGSGASAAGVSAILLSAPLTGAHSVFGERPGEPGPRTDASRSLRGFSPAPGFRFDVDLMRHDAETFLVRFSQPGRTVPYLRGELIWEVTDDDGDVLLEESINTEHALRVASEPLDGPRPSLRRWLFFRAGHTQVMTRATNNIAVLLSAEG